MQPIAMGSPSLAMCGAIGGLRVSRIENHDGRAWRARAEECRAIADTFQNPQTRAQMYRMAEDYERMAERAEEREREAAGQGPESVGLIMRDPGHSDRDSP